MRQISRLVMVDLIMAQSYENYLTQNPLNYENRDTTSSFLKILRILRAKITSREAPNMPSLNAPLYR